jgi:hypothetical protein
LFEPSTGGWGSLLVMGLFVSTGRGRTAKNHACLSKKLPSSLHKKETPGPEAKHEQSRKPGQDLHRASAALLNVEDVERAPQEDDR